MNSPQSQRLHQVAGLVLAAGGAAILLRVIPWTFVRFWLAVGLLWILPGLAWGTLLLRHSLPPVDKWIVALGLSFVLTPLTVLGLSYAPGPVTRDRLLFSLVLLCALPFLMEWLLRRFRLVRRVWPSSPTQGADAGWLLERRRWWCALVLVAFVASLRWINLGYSEFQGDETTVMIRAARVIEGDSSALFEHLKGPAELLVAAANWRLTGITNEWMARLPFSLANVLALAALFSLVRRTASARAGFFALLLGGIEGYLLAFGRIVQYQSLVVALGLLGLLCLWHFENRGEGRLVIVAALLLGGAALAHYDAVFMAIPGLMVLVARLWRDRDRLRTWMVAAIAGLLALLIVAAFYWPYLNSVFIGSTRSYLSKRVGETLRNNVESIFTLSCVYDSVYLLIVLALGVMVQSWCAWRRFGRWGTAVAGFLLLGTTVFFAGTLIGRSPDPAWGFVLLWALALGATIAPAQPCPKRALWLWLAVPGSFYLFFVATPYTHVYTFFVPAIILTACTLEDAVAYIHQQSRPVRHAALVAGSVAFAVCGFYPILMFVQHTPEYRRTFPEHKLEIYWTPYDEIPKFGLFGFPYRAGWKAVGYLMETGALAGDYESNEEPPITNYYLRMGQRWRCPTPGMYITAVNVQDEIPLRWDQVRQDYRPAIFVTVGGEPKIAIHTLDAVGEPTWLPARDYAWRFDQGTTPEAVAGVGVWFAPMPDIQVENPIPSGARLGEHVRLVAYEIDGTRVTAGSFLTVRLMWEALSSNLPHYAVFTHLYADGVLWGQLDGLPVCGERPTTTWEAGEQIVELIRIPVQVDAPPGPVPLRVGMYDPATLERVPAYTAAGEPLGDAIHLGDIVIEPPD